MTDEPGDEKATLLHFLQNQRDSVLSIVDGLSEENWHRSVVPSGWTVAGFVGHLGGAERYWFQHVMTGSVADHPFDEDAEPYDPNAAFTLDKPSADIVDFYRQIWKLSDEALARTPLTAPPVGQLHRPELVSEVTNVRWIVLHVIEETATHSGHLEIARELLDGRTGLGRR